jgi:hypothetical protein
VRVLFRWLLFVLFLAGGLVYLNSAIFHAWASDVPPRLYPEIDRGIANRHFLISIALFLLSAFALWVLRRKKNYGDAETFEP